MIEPTNLYRSSMINSEVSWLNFAAVFNCISTAVFVGVYALIYKALPAKGVSKGIIYGFLIWLGSVFAFLHVYLIVNLSAAIVIYLIAASLVIYLLMGAVTGAFYKK